ncbi:MAG: FadR family transcriptional regulator [Clostridiales bacterium]|nr:FadR family transcriptional regulator [Clostridiales bacterium]
MSGISQIKSKLLVEQVQENIYKYIIDENIAVGEKLPNEFELARKFNVGRSTVREAVKLLISRGILEIRRGAGTYVISRTPGDSDSLGLLALGDKMSLAIDLANLRMMLEPGMAEMAALNATEEDIEKLERLCDSVENKIRRGDDYVNDDIAFHTCIAECSKNKVVEHLVPIIDTTVMMFVNVTHKKLTEETILTHRAVLNAIKDKDVIGARSAMTMHMTYNRTMILNMIKAENKK